MGKKFSKIEKPLASWHGARMDWAMMTYTIRRAGALQG